MKKEKIKVLHILHSLASGGMEGRVARLVSGLDPSEYEISVLTFRKFDYRKVRLPDHVAHVEWEIPSGLHPAKLIGLRNFIRRGRFDIVHTHNWGSMFYGVLAAKLAWTRLIVHGEHGLEVEDKITAKRLWAQRALSRLVHLIVAVNGPIAKFVVGQWKIDPGKVVTIPNGVDLSRFQAAPASRPGPFVVGTVTRFAPVKNLPCLIEAFRLLAAKAGRDAVRMIIVGSGPDFDLIQAECAKAGVADLISFPGDTNRPEDHYPGFSVFVNSSLYEGMSNTMLEAMACGIPVVASDVEGNREWLRDGEGVLFFASGDAADLARILGRCLEEPDLARGLAARGRARVEREFDNRDFIARYEAAYKKSLKRG